MHYKMISRFVLCASFAVLLPSLPGCMAIPAAVAAANGATKTSVAKFTIEGKSSAMTAFHDAAINVGGVVTNSSEDYAKAEFSDTSVKVEIQTIKKGEYQIIGSSNTNVSRVWEFKDNIGETTQKIVDKLVANGFKVTASSKS